MYYILPDSFDSEGLLPIGTYEVTFEALHQSLLVQGPLENRPESWDTEWRRHLVTNAEILARELWEVGITEVYLDGSFTEAKPHPHDIDGYFEVDLHLLSSGELERALNALDPHRCWTWNPMARTKAKGFTKKQLPMWQQYRVEFYPHFPGLMSGITDADGNEMQYPAAFRQRREDGRRKGIVKVVPSRTS